MPAAGVSANSSPTSNRSATTDRTSSRGRSPGRDGHPFAHGDGPLDVGRGQVGPDRCGARALADLGEQVPVDADGPVELHFIDEFSVDELHALIRLIDHVPQFTEHMETDIMPVLAKLDQVGPDVHELLDVLKDVRLAIQGVPGFSLLRRRGADREDDLADERPATEPPVDR